MSLLSSCLFVRQVLCRTGVFSPSTFMHASRLSPVFRPLSTGASAQEQKQNEATAPPPSAADPNGGNSAQAEQRSDVDLKQLQEQNTKLTEDVNDFKDRYKRALAETENTRIRYTKLVNDAKIFGIQGFCKDLLEVADILNLALANTPEQPSTDPSTLKKDFINLRQGLHMTEERMQKIFAKNGLHPIKPDEGDKFDPNFHDALFQAKIPNKTSGTIAQVMKTGYRLQDRVIRAAQVKRQHRANNEYIVRRTLTTSNVFLHSPFLVIRDDVFCLIRPLNPTPLCSTGDLLRLYGICFGGKKSKTSQTNTKRSSADKYKGLHQEHSNMPHDLSRSTANSASSSALSYSNGTSQSTASNNHHFHKKADRMDVSDDDDSMTDEDTMQQKKLKRTPDASSPTQPKLSIVNADMIFYCFEILGNHLFNGKHHLGKHHAPTSSTSGQLVPSMSNLPQVPAEPYPLFVSWFIGTDKQLRGCIGTFSPMNLAQGLREYALTSALNDSRFSPISRDEYPLLYCAVSILTQFEPCSTYLDWDIGLHGIRIEFLNERGSRRSATYLPEVAHEQGWNHIQTLDSLLRKGGYRAPITSDMRKSVHVTRYQSEKLILHYNDYVQYKTTSSITTFSCTTTTTTTTIVKNRPK